MSHNHGKNIAEDATKLAVPKVFMETMMSAMRRVIKFEMAQVRQRLDQMEISLQKRQGPRPGRRIIEDYHKEMEELQTSKSEIKSTHISHIPQDIGDHVTNNAADDLPSLEGISEEDYLAPEALPLVARKALTPTQVYGNPYGQEYEVLSPEETPHGSPFDVGDDLRTNHFQEERNDANPIKASKELVHVPIGLFTRAREKKFKDVLNGLVQ